MKEEILQFYLLFISKYVENGSQFITIETTKRSYLGLGAGT